jgi:hypothetical protein
VYKNELGWCCWRFCHQKYKELMRKIEHQHVSHWPISWLLILQ